MNKISIQKFNGISFIYATSNNVTTCTCVPSGMENKIFEHRLYKSDWDAYKYIDPATQIALSGDGLKRDFSAGYTLFNSDTSFSFIVKKQDRIETKNEIMLTTTFENKDGIIAKQIIKQIKPFLAVEMHFEVINESSENIELEKISSFMIGALSPFQEKNDNDSLLIHEIKNYWSYEGTLKTQSLTDLEFEDSWISLGLKVERICSTGMMATRGYIPFIAVEDTKANVTWAVQLEAIGSWQIEAIHKYGSLSINGGLADFNVGHFRKTLKPNEQFVSSKAYITSVQGDLTKACAILTKYQDTLINEIEIEKDLPIVFNEYLTTWGNPNIELFKKIMPIAKKIGCEYFVCDAGWYDVGKNTWTNIGDWKTDKNKFPKGLKEFSELAKQNEMKASGVWFEFEGVTEGSELFNNHKDWLLTLNNKLIKREDRYLLDFRKQDVIDYLKNKVIKTIKDNNLNYIKVDYNEDVGIGCDGDESIGEGLRQHAIGVLNFFKLLKQEVPNLVIESCSSGGMRHAINFDTIGSMTSFSDSHECLSGATIAMNVHRFIQPRLSQIWVSILPSMSINETYFTLVKGMLGRMCYSGPIQNASKQQIDLAIEASNFYQQIKQAIRDGNTIFIDTNETKSLLKPQGVNRLIRESSDKSELVEYIISYVERRNINIKKDGYELSSYFGNCVIENNTLLLIDNDVCAEVLLFKKTN